MHAKALRRCNGDAELCKGKGECMVLKNAISLVVQPDARGAGRGMRQLT
jgi:hypothetical protein